MNSDQWITWDDIVSSCKAHQRSVNVGTQQRRQAVIAIDAEIKWIQAQNQALRAFINGAITRAELESKIGERQ